MSIKLSELVIACFNMDKMLAFYQNIFDIPFKTVKIPQGSIYLGSIDDIQITLCPASMADIKANENRHQLTFLVANISNCIRKIEGYGGSFINELDEANDCLQIAIRDVDGNSILLKQSL